VLESVLALSVFPLSPLKPPRPRPLPLPRPRPLNPPRPPRPPNLASPPRSSPPRSRLPRKPPRRGLSSSNRRASVDGGCDFTGFFQSIGYGIFGYV